MTGSGFVSSLDWQPKICPTLAQCRWLEALDADAFSVQLSHADYTSAGTELLGAPDEAGVLIEVNWRVVHYAKAFVCAIRRFGRVLEQARLSDFPPAVAEVIKVQRRAKRTLLQSYVKPRDVIEHFAEEIRAPAAVQGGRAVLIDHESKIIHPVFEEIGLSPGKLVLGSLTADLTKATVAKVVCVRNEIISAALLHLPKRKRSQFFGVVRLPFEPI